jgi:hypothetical protein
MGRLSGLLWVALLLPGLLWGQDLAVTEVDVRLQDGVYVLDAEIDYRFNETVLEALGHGVPLTFEVHLQVRRKGAWVWEPDVVEQRLRYLVSYHALTSLYEVSNLTQGVSRSFVTQGAALAFLGEINELPLLNQRELDADEAYVLELRTDLDIEALPLPLRPLAYLTPAWKLSSGWSSWPLQP